jgi:hypothetical protein
MIVDTLTAAASVFVGFACAIAFHWLRWHS